MRVLVADDESRARLALRLFLEERGLVVIGEAATAQEILPLLQGLRPDLLLLDWELPGLAEERRLDMPAWARSLRIVALSSGPTADRNRLPSPIEFVGRTDPPDCLIAALSTARLPRSHELADTDAASRPDSALPDSSL